MSIETFLIRFFNAAFQAVVTEMWRIENQRKRTVIIITFVAALREWHFDANQVKIDKLSTIDFE